MDIEVKVKLILAAQSWSKKCPVFLMVEGGGMLGLPTMHLYMGTTPIEVVSSMLKETIGVGYNEADGGSNWLFPTIDGASIDKTTGDLVLTYNCIIPESNDPPKGFVWKTIADIMTESDAIFPYDLSILHKYAVGEKV